MVFERLCGGFMQFGLHERIQKDVVLGVGNTACRDALGLAARELWGKLGDGMRKAA